MPAIPVVPATQTIQTACIILAGGRSTRMGTDKALLPLAHTPQRTFLAHLAATLAPSCDELLLVARDEHQATHYRAVTNIRIATDHIPNSGPLMGIYSGLSATQAAKALVVAVDMPFVQPPLVAWLLASAGTDAITVPVVNNVPQVLFAVYPRSILPYIQTNIAQGRRDPRSLLTTTPVHYIDEAQLRPFDPQLRSFTNINTPEELRDSLSF